MLIRQSLARQVGVHVMQHAKLHAVCHDGTRQHVWTRPCKADSLQIPSRVTGGRAGSSWKAAVTNLSSRRRESDRALRALLVAE